LILRLSQKFNMLRPAILSLVLAFSVQAQNTAAEKQAALAQKGQAIATAVCSACHGSDGVSLQAANPSLAGMPAAYIVEQLQHFKSDVRVNPVMKGFAAGMAKEDMQAVGEYFSRQKPRIVGYKDKALALEGQALYRAGDAKRGIPACSGCHSPTGAGMASKYPRLGGQHADYTAVQLTAFKTGTRGAHAKDEDGKIMTAIASRLSEREIKALAEYTQGLK
jgi:cytochrome c553